MKKLLGLILCITLAVACLSPLTVTAFAAAADEETVHFVNPTAMTVLGDYLYVADNVEENKCAVLIFDLRGEAPKQAGTYELDGTVINLACDGQNTLYAVCGNKVFELAANGSLLTEKTVYAEFEEDILDFTNGVFVGSETLYALTANKLLKKEGTVFNPANQTTNENNICFINYNDCIFYITRIGTETQIKCYDEQNGSFRNVVFATTGFIPKGLFVWENKLAMHSADSMCYFTETSKNNYAPSDLLTGVKTDDGKDCNIVDVAASNAKLYVLKDNKKIDIYEHNAEDEQFVLSFTIGSDVVGKDVPTEYTDFTLVRSKGYPTNIIYKTKADTGIDNLIDDADEFIVLGYDGDESSGYYYVLTDGKFGWVKKSQATATVATDAKLQICDLKLDNGQVGYVTKFNSLGGITVYTLPHHASATFTVTQTATEMKEVTVLKRFTEETADKTYNWYWVEYGEGERGFVERSALGNFRVKPKTDEEIVPLGDRKINSTLFEAVTLYADKGMAETDAVYDEQDNLIKLYSGDRVTVISEEDGASFIMRQRNDGTRDFGWVSSDRLIGVHSITTNAIVGLSLLAFAVALTVTLLVVFTKRKKRLKKATDDNK